MEQLPLVHIVSGLPRSGTSLMMQMLVAGGMIALTDDRRAADASNPKGYFEYEPVKSIARDNSWVTLAEGKVVKVILQLLPFLPLGFHYKVVLMDRCLDEVMKSQATMLARKTVANTLVRPEILKQTFAKHLEQTRDQLNRNANSSLLVVCHHQLLEQPKSTISAIADFMLPQKLDFEAMLQSIDKSLYRSRSE